MEYYCDFPFYHQLVDASQMFEEFESFYFNGNDDNGSWYGKPNFLPAPHLIWFVESQISGKWFLIVLKNVDERKRKCVFL